MLIVEGLHVHYGPVAAVRGITFTCAPGEVVTIVGANGAGKSTTLLALAGGIRATVRGRAELDGRSLLGVLPEQRVRMGIALVPERRRILATLTVRENLLVATAPRRHRRDAVAEIGSLMDRFPILGTRADGPAGLLSGGEQQQLAIARAMLARPKIMLLDEPSLGLAPQVIDDVFTVIEELRNGGIGVVLVEQNARRAATVADRALLLRHGEIDTVADQDHAGALDAYFGLAAADD